MKEENIKVIIAFVIGVVISGIGVYVVTKSFQKDQVISENNEKNDLCTKENTKLDTCNTDKTACQESLSTCNNNLEEAKANKFLARYKTLAGEPSNYTFDGKLYEYDMKTNSISSSAPPTPPSGKNVYLAFYNNDYQTGVCIKRKGKQECFRFNDWIAEKDHIQEVFNDINCTVDLEQVICKASDFNCSVKAGGDVMCEDMLSHSQCIIEPASLTSQTLDVATCTNGSSRT